MVNESDRYLWLNQFDEVIESVGSSHPDAVTLLAAPGGTVPGDVVSKHKLADRIKATDPDAVKFDPVGNAIVIEDGRARAVATLPEDDERRIKGLAAEAEHRKEKAKAQSPSRLLGQINQATKGAVPVNQPKPDAPKPGVTVEPAKVPEPAK